MLVGNGNDPREGHGKKTQQWIHSAVRDGGIQIDPRINT